MSDFEEQQQTDEKPPAIDPSADPAEGAVVPVWNDITGDFFGAVKDLKLGELVHNEFFGLFEAMSAIEMMDPKMDAGMCCNKNTRAPLTFETAVQSNQLKLTDLAAAEVIGVTDGVLSCLVSWLEGHSVAQTLFTCLYLHQPHQIKNKPLRAFCLGMHNLFQVIRKIILFAQVYEEEDFEFRDYEFDVHPNVSDARASALLKEAEETLWLQRRNKPFTDVEAAEAVDNAAIISRLRFVRLLLDALVPISPHTPAKVTPCPAEMAHIQQMLAATLETIQTIRNTLALGTQPVPDADEPNPMGFSPLVNQRLLPPTFPRFTKIKARADAVDFLEALVLRLSTVCNIIHCRTYHGALNFFIEFSRNTPPCLLSRACLQTLYFPAHRMRFGVTRFGDVLHDAMRSFISPPVLTAHHPLASNEHALHCFGAFGDYCSTIYPFVAFLQLCGFNKARQRDKLVRLLVDLANVGEEAERVDAYMHSLFIKDHADVAAALAATVTVHGCDAAAAVEVQPYFFNWTLYHSLRAMHLYLLAGIELELYAQHEYVYVFWYMSQFLCNWLTTTLSRADQLAERSRMVAARWPHVAKPKAKGNKQQPQLAVLNSAAGGASVSAAFAGEYRRREENPYYRELLLNQAHSFLYGGYYRAMVAFDREGRVQQPLSVFDNEKVRFEHRFAPFACNASLPPVPYEEFAAQRAFLVTEISLDKLYTEAAKSFQRARLMLETLAGTAAIESSAESGGTVATDQEVADLIHVSKVNMIVMNLMAKGHMKGTKNPPTFDFSTHKFYPTIRIQ